MHAGEDVLSWLSFGHTSIGKTLGAEARILAFYYWLTFSILKAKKPRFETIQPAAAGSGGGSGGARAALGSSGGGGERAPARAAASSGAGEHAPAGVEELVAA